MKELNKYKLRLILCIILVCVALVTVLIALHDAYMLYEEIQWAIRVDFGVERILRASRGALSPWVLRPCWASGAWWISCASPF